MPLIKYRATQLQAHNELLGKRCQFSEQSCSKTTLCSVNLEAEIARHIKEYKLGRKVAEKVEKYNWKLLSSYCMYGGKDETCP